MTCGTIWIGGLTVEQKLQVYQSRDSTRTIGAFQTAVDEEGKNMFTPDVFKLKKGKEEQARKICVWIAIASVLLGVCDYLIIENSLLRCLSDSMVCFWSVSYCVLGYKKCYKVKAFKGHKILRWCALVLVSFYCVLGIILYFTGQIGIYMPALAIFTMALFMSITMVRNGYQ